jgi:hypothetical protein
LSIAACTPCLGDAPILLDRTAEDAPGGSVSIAVDPSGRDELLQELRRDHAVVLGGNVAQGVLESDGGVSPAQVVAAAGSAADSGLERWRLRKLGQLHLKLLLGGLPLLSAIVAFCQASEGPRLGTRASRG